MKEMHPRHRTRAGPLSRLWKTRRFLGDLLGPHVSMRKGTPVKPIQGVRFSRRRILSFRFFEIVLVPIATRGRGDACENPRSGQARWTAVEVLACWGP